MRPPVALAAATLAAACIPTAQSDPPYGAPTPDERAACATADPYGFRPPFSYWPPRTFESDAEEDAFRRNWYSAQLCAMGEAPLSPSVAGQRRIRFLWLRSFDPGVSVRVDHSEGETKLVAVELSGRGGLIPGEEARRITRDLSADKWSAIEQSLNASAFWNLPTSASESGIGFDGSQWIVEVAEPQRHHVVDRWSGRDLEPIGRLLLKYSGLSPSEIY